MEASGGAAHGKRDPWRTRGILWPRRHNDERRTEGREKGKTGTYRRRRQSDSMGG